MTDDQHESFIHYWEDVDAAMLKLFGIHTGDAGIEPGLIAAAQEDGTTPEEFSLSWAERYGLVAISELKARLTLRKAGYILRLWHVDDVQATAQEEIGRCLTNRELDQVRGALEDIDADIGIHWQSIRSSIEFVTAFGEDAP